MIIHGKMRKPVAIRRGKSRHAPAHMAKSVVFVLRSDTHVRERAETAPHRRTSYVLRTFHTVHTFSATLSKAYTRKRHLSGRAGIRQLFLAVMSPWRIDTIQGVQMLNKRTGRGTGNCARPASLRQSVTKSDTPKVRDWLLRRRLTHLGPPMPN
jgi:hypothetical protein